MPWLNLAMAPFLFVGLTLVAIATGTGAFADPVRWRMAGWKTDFSKATVSLGEIISGGPPRDGIPPIDQPLFKPANEVKDLPGREPVIVYPLTAEARAYPLRILMWHEIANDTVAGIPIAVTYCPLCNAALVFDRRVAGRILDFGTSGLLRHSDLVMWDRQTESWWQQFSGEAIVGAYAGTSLKLLPSQIAAYDQFLHRWPGNQVLVPRNPHLRNYGRNPYSDYDEATAPMLFRGELPRGLPAMARVVIARTPQGPVAISLAYLSKKERVEHLGVIFTWRSGQATALGASEIAKGKDVGNVEVSDASGAPLVHDITFAFVYNAFVKGATVLTEKGSISLVSGEPAVR
jgi:hypothetical protein